MGRSTTSKYRVVFTLNASFGFTPFSWRTREAGKPTAANLAKFVEGYNESMKPGGVNENLSADVPGGLRIISARLETNVPTGEVMEIKAEWNAPVMETTPA